MDDFEQFSQNWWFGSKKSSKFEENSKINNYALVLQIDHPVALCDKDAQSACNSREDTLLFSQDHFTLKGSMTNSMEFTPTSSLM